MKDLILGAYDNYNWDQLKYWVNSIKASGFNGDIIMVAFNSTKETVKRLAAEGVMVVAMMQNGDGNYVHQSSMPIHTERFFHFFNILKDHAYKYRYVIMTDTKDVIFQDNPSLWLESFLYDKRMVVGTECMKYKDEPWGNQNMEQTFGPYFHNYFKYNPIYNVGVIAGESETIRDLCLSIFLIVTNRPIAICDQSTFNALLYTRPYQEITLFPDMHESWVAHLGTVMDPSKIDQFRPFLTEKEPTINKDDEVVTNDGIPFTIIHQYDRVPQLKKIIEAKYA